MHAFNQGETVALVIEEVVRQFDELKNRAADLRRYL
jgi:hypothetical protein